MRVLILAADFKPSLGGVAEYTHQVARHLQEMGDEVLVLARPAAGGAAFDAGCPYQVQRVLAHPADKPLFITRVRRLTSVVRSFGADLLLANAPLSEPLAGRITAWLNRLPFAIIVHGQELSNYNDPDILSITAWKKQLVVAVAFRRAGVVIANSNFTRSLLLQLGVEEARSVVIHPAINARSLQAQLVRARKANVILPLPTGRPILLTLGRLVERKGIDTVLESLPSVIQEVTNVLYVVVGDGPDRARLERHVAKHNLANHVYFAGRVSEAEKALYYDAADVFVMPNRTLPDGDVEGFGIVFLEANFHGKAVIGGASGGAVDAIIHGKTGLLVAPDDVNKLATAISRLLTDRDYAQQLGERGREHVLTNLTWARSTAKLKSILSGLQA